MADPQPQFLPALAGKLAPGLLDESVLKPGKQQGQPTTNDVTRIHAG
jgi:hypothetical protein